MPSGLDPSPAADGKRSSRRVCMTLYTWQISTGNVLMVACLYNSRPILSKWLGVSVFGK